MDCKETQKNIMSFLRDELDEDITDAFMQHVCSCKECMEELTIQYLVTEGLQRLETASAFDAQKELQEKIETAIAKRKLHKKIKIVLFSSGILIALIALIVLDLFFL